MPSENDRAKHAAAERAELDSPASVRERQRSRTAYESTSPAQSKALLAETFAATIDSLESDAGILITDLDVKRFFGRWSALVKAEDGKAALVDSTTPLRVEDESSESRQLDLTLAREGDRYVALNPIVDISLPATASGAISVGSEGFSLSLDRPTTTAGDRLERNLFYPDASQDLDLLVAPIASGAEIFAQLRSAASPEEVVFNLKLPAGASAHQVTDGAIEIRNGSKTLNRVLPPVAVDAQGSPVAVDMSLADGQLTISVAHRGEGIAYPILVDPVVDSWSWTTSSTGLDAWDWNSGIPAGPDVNTIDDPRIARYNMSKTCITGTVLSCASGSPGLHQTPWTNRTYGWQEWSQWFYWAPGATTYITQADLGPITHRYDSRFPQQFVSTASAWSPSNNRFVEEAAQCNCHFWDETSGDGGYAANQVTDHFPRTGRDSGLPYMTAAEDVEFVSVALQASGQGTVQGSNQTPRQLRTQGAVVLLDDKEGATTDPPTHNPALPTAWVASFQGSASALGRDPGLGVKTVTVETPKPGGGTDSHTRTVNCTGGALSRCPASYAPNPALSYSTATMPEGNQQIRMSTQDALGKTDSSQGPRTWSLKIDRSPPDISVGGDLVTGFGWDLHVDATDGSAGSPTSQRSGVRVLKAHMDNNTLFPIVNQTADCTAPEGSCSKSFDYSVPPSTANGHHTITIQATDQLGHTKTVVVPFRVSMNGDVYHAWEYTGDPAAGGRQLTVEWVRLGTNTARTEERNSAPAQGNKPASTRRDVTTRSPAGCPDGSAGCDEVRTVDTLTFEGFASQTGFSRFRGSRPDDANLPEISELLFTSRASLGNEVGFGLISQLLAPWHKPPPGGSLFYRQYEKKTPIEGSSGNVVHRRWVQDGTRLLLKSEVRNEATGAVDVRYWSYQNKRWFQEDLPSDWFAVARPDEPDFEEEVVASGDEPVGSTEDRETGNQFTPYSLGGNSTAQVDGALTRLCLDSGDVVFFGGGGPAPAPDPDQAADPALKADPDAPQTFTAANYNLLAQAANCVPGLELGGIPDLDVISTYKGSTYGGLDDLFHALRP